MDLDQTIKKTLRMLDAGFSIGIWGVLHPKYEKTILETQDKCRKLGIDFRIKEFLGEYNGKLYGTYKYPGACDRKFRKNVQCRASEFIIDSKGNIFRCHADLYAGVKSIGHILSSDFEIENKFKDCSNFGHCNPCDIKVKTNRFQHFGHTSVEIKME
jgi:hypothetical protein